MNYVILNRTDLKQAVRALNPTDGSVKTSEISFRPALDRDLEPDLLFRDLDLDLDLRRPEDPNLCLVL